MKFYPETRWVYSQNAKLMFEKKNIITMSIPELWKNKPEKKLRISEITKEMSTKKIFTHHTYISVIRGRSQTTLTRRGG